MVTGIIGLGLMGGSFGRTLVKQGHTVYGLDVSETVKEKAEMIKAVTDRLTEKNAGELDMLVSAVNPSDFAAATKPFLPLLKDGAIVLDFAGTKRGVVCEMQKMAKRFKNLCFLGGHPMAGREYSGIDHSSITLFNKASMILVNVSADIFALDKVKKFFLSLGFGEVVITTAENHDRMIAFTSQMCHVVSNAYIKSPTAEQHFGYSAGSYKDMTRVARLNPDMWTELMIQNSDYLADELSLFIDNLKKYEKAVKDKDAETLRALLAEGNERKIKIDSGSRGKC